MACLPSGLESLRDAVPSSRNLVVSYFVRYKGLLLRSRVGDGGKKQ